METKFLLWTPGQLVSLLGLFVILGIAWLLSENRKKVSLRVVVWGVLLQFIFALIVLKTTPGLMFFDFIRTVVDGLLKFTGEGSKFIFGGLVGDMKTFGFIFAFQVLPTIIFFSSLMSILYYYGIMQKVVEAVAKVMMKCMGTSGAETLCCSANIFVGQTEAPLLIKPYMEGTTRSELIAVMIGGFGTIAVGVMGAYVGMLSEFFPDVAGHILTASVMSAPAALLISKILIPETGEPRTKGVAKVQLERTEANVIDAAAGGASLGMQLALNVAAMLLAFLALIAMIDFGLSWVGSLFHVTLNLSTIFGTVFSPVAWIMGVPWKDCRIVGDLIGKLIVMNEFVAYSELARILKESASTIDPRSVLIAVYALCGFCNLGSIAIQIGGLSGLAPSRRGDLARLGVKALIGGALTNFTTACIAGFLISTVTLTPPAPKPETPSATPAQPSTMRFQLERTGESRAVPMRFRGVAYSLLTSSAPPRSSSTSS